MKLKINKIIKLIGAFFAFIVLLNSCEPESNLLDGIRPVTFKATANKSLITAGESIIYIDSSLQVVSRKWTFEGGNIASSDQETVTVIYPEASPTETTGGIRRNVGFPTMLEITKADGSVESNTFKVKVFKKVEPEFIADRNSDMIGSTIQFFDRTLDGQSSFEEARKDDTILWEFEGGSPATSTARNPSVTYAAQGKYDVKLTVKRGTPGSMGTTTKTDFIDITLMASCDESVNLIDCGNTDGEVDGLNDWVVTGNGGEDKSASFSVTQERKSEGDGSLKYVFDEAGKAAFTSNFLRMSNKTFNVPASGSYTLSMDVYADILSTGQTDFAFELYLAKIDGPDGPKQFFRSGGNEWIKGASTTKTLSPGDYYVFVKLFLPGFDTNIKYNFFMDNIMVVKN